MGSGKTNYAVNELLDKTTYKHVICNVPLTDEYKNKLQERGVEVEIFDKMDPRSVIDKISSENPQCFFIVDESQLCLTSANVALCKLFAKKMSQIRQDDQDVNLIAQSTKMLPAIIKDVGTDCFKFENNNIKGRKKSSHVEHFKTGYTYLNCKVDEFTYSHIYGNYITSNWETTEQPKNLYKKVYIKLGAIILAFVLILIYLIHSFSSSYDKINKPSNDKKTDIKKEQTNVKFTEIKQDSICVRSWQSDKRGIVYWIDKKGNYTMSAIDYFVTIPKCPLP